MTTGVSATACFMRAHQIWFLGCTLAVVVSGPFLLDLGDALYAPNCFKDGQGRRLMLGWFQELGGRGPSSGFTYSGCLTLPRVLSRQGAVRNCWESD